MSVLTLRRSFDLPRIKTEHPRGWEAENPSRSPLFPIPPKLPKCVKSDAIGKSVGEASIANIAELNPFADVKIGTTSSCTDAKTADEFASDARRASTRW